MKNRKRTTYLIIMICVVSIVTAAEERSVCDRPKLSVMFILDTVEDKLNVTEQMVTRSFWMDFSWWAVHGTYAKDLAVITAGTEAETAITWNDCGNDMTCSTRKIADIKFKITKRKPAFTRAFNLAIDKFRELNSSFPKVLVVITDQLPSRVGASMDRALRSLQDISLNVERHLLAQSEMNCNQPFAAKFTKPDNCLVGRSYRDIRKQDLANMICSSTVRGRVYVPQAVPLEVCYSKADIALLVDRSGSIIGDDNEDYIQWIQLRRFLTDLINGFGVGLDKTRVAIISFANPEYTRVHVNLDGCANASCLQDVIWDIPSPNGKTDTYGAFMLADRDVFNGLGGDRRDAVDIILCISDGIPVPHNIDLYTLVDDMKNNKKINILTVGITNHTDERMMQIIASDPPEENFFKVKDFDRLLLEVEGIQSAICKTSAKEWTLPDPTCGENSTSNPGDDSCQRFSTPTSNNSYGPVDGGHVGKELTILLISLGVIGALLVLAFVLMVTMHIIRLLKPLEMSPYNDLEEQSQSQESDGPVFPTIPNGQLAGSPGDVATISGSSAGPSIYSGSMAGQADSSLAMHTISENLAEAGTY